MSNIKSGFAIHCHHDILVEYCYNYDERVAAIKRDKPQNEQEIRLRLFKLLPDEALKDLPTGYQKAYQEWSQADKDAFHKKWCRCKEWDGSEIIFKEKEDEMPKV